MLKTSVLVLNQNYEPMHICQAKRAIVLVLLGKAEVIEHYQKEVHSVSVSIHLPSVVRLYVYINGPRKDVALNRKNISKRDNYQCQYCGISKEVLTTDHVIPKSLGGRDSWTNLVTACTKCNNKKGNRMPEQAGMKLLKIPKKPHRFTYMAFFSSIPDVRWRPYLFLD